MNNKSKAEKLFLAVISGIILCSLFLIVGCTGSCFGCNIGCECVDEGCVSGCGDNSNTMGTDKSLTSATQSCVDTENAGKVWLISCYDYSQSEDCGSSSCYSGMFCNACGSCGLFCGDSTKSTDLDIDEKSEETLGCMSGCFTCSDTGNHWLDAINVAHEGLGF